MKCGHAVPKDGCMDCLEEAMLHDEARKGSEVRSAAAGAGELSVASVAEIVSILSEHVGETGASESAVEVARRLSDFWKSWGAVVGKIHELEALVKDVPAP